jgi:drug/metabolite transporter (DMT)-like permease
MTRRHWLLFASMCCIWGVPYLLIRIAVRDISAPDLVFARTGIAALMLLPVALWRHELEPVFRRWRPLLAYTMVELAIPWVLLSHAETTISSSLAGLLVAAVPLAGVVMLRVLGGHEVIGPSTVIGLFMGFAGVASLVGLDLQQANGIALGEVAVVVLGYALGPIIFSRSLSDLPAIGIVTASLSITALMYLPIAATNPPKRLSGGSVASVLVLASVCTALAFVLFFALIAGIGPARAVVITYVNPAVAVLLGVLTLGEKLTIGMAVGFPLIMAGSILAARRGREVAPEPGAVPATGSLTVKSARERTTDRLPS